ncbi:MAG: multi-sensor hybrid histidine kinase [uncultured bacterium]|nr:MAG: multi-sensor hybrid histidine kinase [uncultured bacterium]
MKKPSDPEASRDSREQLRQSIIGLGERSIRKSYYPELQQRIAELERSNRELQQEIAERREAQASAKKLARQLQQSQKMEAIGTLAGGIAHDFNNILSAIIGYTELAQLHMVSGCDQGKCPAAKDLDRVLFASERAKELVRQILTFSRQQDYEQSPLRLGQVVTEALGLLRSSLPQSVEIRTKIEVEDELILGNATQIHQIVMNLGTNAKHAIGEKGGVLAVEIDRIEIEPIDEKSKNLQLAPGPYLVLKICDNGCGMERAMLDKIFDPYFTTKPKDQGTGMGLAVVHGIVKGHNGLITVYSEPGKGTSFLIYFPQLVDIPANQTIQYSQELPMGTERILLVDDEVLIARMQGRLLSSLGYTVTVETDPLHALATFAANPAAYDLVVTDMTMPGMNGAGLTRHILGIRADMPVILCTGFSELINETKALAIGVKTFAMKPLVRKSIAKIVRKALDT